MLVFDAFKELDDAVVNVDGQRRQVRLIEGSPAAYFSEDHLRVQRYVAPLQHLLHYAPLFRADGSIGAGQPGADHVNGEVDSQRRDMNEARRLVEYPS